MKKLLILPMLLCLIFTVSANAPRVDDGAGLLIEQEILFLEEEFDAIEAAQGIDLAVVTVESLGGKSISAYADDYYDDHGYGVNGALLLLDMEGRNWWVSTSGSCIRYIDSQELGMYFVPYLSQGEYYQAFSLFGMLVNAVMENPGIDGEFVVDAEGLVHYQEKTEHWYDGIWQCLVIGCVIGLIVVTVMAAGMKTVRAKYSAADYVDRNSLHFTRKEDRYLYQTMTRRAKPKNNSSSHRGSSGRSHGGGGGRF